MRILFSLIFFLTVFTFVSCKKSHRDTDPWKKLSSSFSGQLLSIQFYKDTGFILGLNTEIGNRYNALLKTTDRGNTWDIQTFPEPEPGGVGRLFVCNPKLLFASKDGIFKSTDEGISWEATDSDYNSVMNLTNGIYFVNTSVGITVMGGIIYKTIDGANHFNQVYNEQSSFTLQSLQFISANVGYATGGDPGNNEGFILKTTDQGNSWSKYPFAHGFINALYFVNENTGFCLVTQDLYETTDGGSSWYKKNNESIGQNDGGKLFFTNENDGFLITHSGKIYHTNNAGKVWNLEHTENGLQLNDITADQENHVFVIGQNGLILSRN